MTTRSLADFFCGKDRCVRFLFSIVVPKVSCHRSAWNNVRRSLYLKGSYPEIFADGRGCGRKLAGRATGSTLGELRLPSSTISPGERVRSLLNAKNAEARCEITISVDALRHTEYSQERLSLKTDRDRKWARRISKSWVPAESLLRWRVVGVDRRKLGSVRGPIPLV